MAETDGTETSRILSANSANSLRLLVVEVEDHANIARQPL